MYTEHALLLSVKRMGVLEKLPDYFNVITHYHPGNEDTLHLDNGI